MLSCGVVNYLKGQTMAEQWLPVVGYEGRYEVSDLGRVRSMPKCNRPSVKIMTCVRHHSGYLIVSMRKVDGGRCISELVHCLVCEAFHGARPDGMEVRHLDGDKSNNQAVNLMWGTRVENYHDDVERGTRRLKLDDNDVKMIRALQGSVSSGVIARKFGVSPSMVLQIWSGHRRSSVA